MAPRHIGLCLFVILCCSLFFTTINAQKKQIPQGVPVHPLMVEHLVNKNLEVPILFDAEADADFPQTANTPYINRVTFSYQPQETDATWILPVNRAKAHITITPFQPISNSQWVSPYVRGTWSVKTPYTSDYSINPITPATNDPTQTEVEAYSFQATGAYTELGGLPSSASASERAFRITYQFASNAPLTTTQQFIFTFYGCISTTSQPLLPSECTSDKVRVVHSFVYDFLRSDARDPQGVELVHHLPPTVLPDTYCEQQEMTSHSYPQLLTGTDVAIAGGAFVCYLNLARELWHAVAADRMLLKFDVIKLNSYIENTTTMASFGYGQPDIVVTHYFRVKELYDLETRTPSFYLFRVEEQSGGNTISKITSLLDFTNPQQEYRIRFSFAPQDVLLNANVPLYAAYPIEYSFQNKFKVSLDYYLGDEELKKQMSTFHGTALHHTFKVLSQCDLPSLCLTTQTNTIGLDGTPEIDFCDPYDFSPWSQEFQCQCQSLFGGSFCEFSWYSRECRELPPPNIPAGRGYDCYIRWSPAGHMPDRYWALSPGLSSSCSDITPPVSTACVQDDTTASCQQLNPIQLITSQSNPKAFTTFTIGSAVQCGLNYHTLISPSTRSIEYKVYAIFDTTQTTRQPLTDYNVYTQTMAIQTTDDESDSNTTFLSGVTFNLAQSEWFTPPSLLNNNNNLELKNFDPTTVRWYVSLSPSDFNYVSYTPIYNLQTSCDYYQTICPTSENFMDCNDLPSAPFIPLYRNFTQKNCLCRDGYAMNINTNQCELFTITNNCEDGVVTANTPTSCCYTHPHIKDVADICKVLGGPPAISYIALKKVNELAMDRVDNIILNANDEITIEWATIGNITTQLNHDESLYGNLYLYSFHPSDNYGNIIDNNTSTTTSTQTTFKAPLNHTIMEHLTQYYLNQQIYSNDYNNIIITTNNNNDNQQQEQQQGTKIDLSTSTPEQLIELLNLPTRSEFAPLFLRKVKLSDGMITFKLPSDLKLTFNGVLVLSFMSSYEDLRPQQQPSTNDDDQENNNEVEAKKHLHWVIGTTSAQHALIHTTPSCLTLDVIEDNDEEEKQYILQGKTLCSHNGKCNYHTGTCDCPNKYNKYVTRPSVPELCQIDVCGSGFLTCYNGMCDDEKMECRCAPGWVGEFCEIPIQCNPYWPIDQRGFVNLEECADTETNNIPEQCLLPLDTFPDYNAMYNQQQQDIIASEQAGINYQRSTCSPNGNGFVEYSTLTKQCKKQDDNDDEQCTCLEGYDIKTKCNTCDTNYIQCRHNTIPNLNNNCNSCICNRYTYGPTCACHKLPLVLTTYNPVIDLNMITTLENIILEDNLINGLIQNKEQFDIMYYLNSTMFQYYNLNNEYHWYIQNVINNLHKQYQINNNNVLNGNMQQLPQGITRKIIANINSNDNTVIHNEVVYTFNSISHDDDETTTEENNKSQHLLLTYITDYLQSNLNNNNLTQDSFLVKTVQITTIESSSTTTTEDDNDNKYLIIQIKKINIILNLFDDCDITQGSSFNNNEDKTFYGTTKLNTFLNAFYNNLIITNNQQPQDENNNTSSLTMMKKYNNIKQNNNIWGTIFDYKEHIYTPLRNALNKKNRKQYPQWSLKRYSEYLINTLAKYKPTTNNNNNKDNEKEILNDLDYDNLLLLTNQYQINVGFIDPNSIVSSNNRVVYNKNNANQLSIKNFDLIIREILNPTTNSTIQQKIEEYTYNIISQTRITTVQFDPIIYMCMVDNPINTITSGSSSSSTITPITFAQSLPRDKITGNIRIALDFNCVHNKATGTDRVEQLMLSNYNTAIISSSTLFATMTMMVMIVIMIGL